MNLTSSALLLHRWVASPPTHPPHADPSKCMTRSLFITIIVRFYVVVAVVFLFSLQPLPVLRWHEQRAAVRRLSAALFAARAAAVYVQEAVLQGQCRPLPESSSSPVLCLLCFALPGLRRRGPRTVPSWACFAPERRCSPQRRLRSARSCWMVAPVE